MLKQSIPCFIHFLNNFFGFAAAKNKRLRE
jgi:hypothetical protein